MLLLLSCETREEAEAVAEDDRAQGESDRVVAMHSLSAEEVAALLAARAGK